MTIWYDNIMYVLIGKALIYRAKVIDIERDRIAGVMKINKRQFDRNSTAG